jgi:uncharacterized protein YjlB
VTQVETHSFEDAGGIPNSRLPVLVYHDVEGAHDVDECTEWHCNEGSSDDLLVVGAYPNGMRWDLRRGDLTEHEEVLANIAAVPLPDADPVHGSSGPLTEIWHKPA